MKEITRTNDTGKPTHAELKTLADNTIKQYYSNPEFLGKYIAVYYVDGFHAIGQDPIQAITNLNEVLAKNGHIIRLPEMTFIKEIQPDPDPSEAVQPTLGFQMWLSGLKS